MSSRFDSSVERLDIKKICFMSGIEEKVSFYMTALRDDKILVEA